MRPGPPGPRRAGWRDRPHPSRLAADHPARAEILARHRRACEAGLSTYLDPGTGWAVMTADYLAARGACCGSGCRHCPWEGATTPDGPGPAGIIGP